MKSKDSQLIVRVDLDEAAFDIRKTLPSGVTIRLKTTSDGPTQVLRISQVADQALTSHAPTLIRQSTSLVTRRNARSLLFELEIKEIIVSLVNQKGKIVSNLALLQVLVSKIRSSNHDETHEFSVANVQIDNALQTARYPVALKSEPVGGQPFLRIVMVHSFASQQNLLQSLRLRVKLRQKLHRRLEATRHSGAGIHRTSDKSPSLSVWQYDYVGFAMQNMTVMLDDLFINEALEIWNEVGSELQRGKIAFSSSLAASESGKVLLTPEEKHSLASLQLDAVDVHIEGVNASPDSVAGDSRWTAASDHSPLLFIDRFEIGNLSCVLTMTVSGGATNAVFRGILSQFLSVKDAGLQMEAVRLYRVFSTRSELAERLILHYKSKLLPSALRMLGSVEVLGNPLGLITKLGTGLGNFAKQAFSKDVMGVPRGAASLMKNTVSGVSDSVSGLTHGVSGLVAQPVI